MAHAHGGIESVALRGLHLLDGGMSMPSIPPPARGSVYEPTARPSIPTTSTERYPSILTSWTSLLFVRWSWGWAAVDSVEARPFLSVTMMCHSPVVLEDAAPLQSEWIRFLQAL